VRRALCSLVVLACCACGATRPLSFGGAGSAKKIGAALDASDACRGTPDPVVLEPSPVVPSVEPPWGAQISKVEVIGAAHVPRDLLFATIKTKAGAPLDADAIARDIRALHELEAIDDARVDAELLANDRVILRFILGERRVVGSVSYRWPTPLTAGHWVPLAKGELWDAARVARMRLDLERNLIEAGHLDAKVEARHVVADESVHVCFLVEQGPKYAIDRLRFTGNERVPSAELAALLHTHEHRVNEAGKPYREDLLEGDLLYVSALYYDRGFLGVKVGPPRVETALDASGNGRLTVDIPIVEGPIYRIRSFRFAGMGPHAEHAKHIGIKIGEVFQRSKLLDGIEKIRAFHRARGEAVEVTPATTMDPTKGEVALVFNVSRDDTAVKK
jgi:outer membrane protein insertion porin family